MLPDRDLGSRLRRHVDRAARVVTVWVEDRTYHDGRGAPASLTFESERGPGSTELVTQARERLSERGQALLEDLNAEMSAQDAYTRPDACEVGVECRSCAMIGIHYFEAARDGDD